MSGSHNSWHSYFSRQMDGYFQMKILTGYEVLDNETEEEKKKAKSIIKTLVFVLLVATIIGLITE